MMFVPVVELWPVILSVLAADGVVISTVADGELVPIPTFEPSKVNPALLVSVEPSKYSTPPVTPPVVVPVPPFAMPTVPRLKAPVPLLYASGDVAENIPRTVEVPMAVM